MMNRLAAPSRWFWLRAVFAIVTASVLTETCALAATTNDPWCGPGGTSMVVRSAIPLPASTRRMIERMEALDKTIDPTSVPFLNSRLVDPLRRRLIEATNFNQQVSVRFKLAVELLQAGQTEAALAEFQTMETAIASIGGKIEGRGAVELRMRKAVGLLRLGEQENCLANHNNQSCLFPIQPAAYHKLPRGSRGAVALFSEQLKAFPQDLSARWLLNIAYMTLGEYPDKVPAEWLIPPATFVSDHPMPRFPDVAAPLGLDVDDLAGGCILEDFDNDGFTDIVASAWGMTGQLRYFHNDGNGRFTERTAHCGFAGVTSGLNIQQTDYNNDGWLDIWVLRGAWLGKAGRLPNSLLRNNGNGTFTDVTEEAGLLSFHPTQTAVWFDYDGDGWLDMFVGNETATATRAKDPDPCELFHNNRNGTFTECAAAVGLNVNRFVKGVASADYDHDGRPDLYLSCRRAGENILFHNDGPAEPGGTNGTRWKFSQVTRSAGVHDTNLVSFPTWFFDYDNDGWEDLFVSGYWIEQVGDIAASYMKMPHMAALPRLFRNNGNGSFSDMTVAAKLDRACLTMGCNFGDLDNDGWLDMYLGTGDPDFTTLIPNRMFRNAEGKFFQDVTTATGTGHLQKGHGVGFADLDHDGDQDIYAVIGGAYTGDNYRNALFMNPSGPTNRWLKLKLEGTRSNRAAIGARIKVVVSTPTGARAMFKTVNSGGSFGSNPLRQEFGLANATNITAVEVFWPVTGQTQRFTGLELDHAYRIREGDAKPVAMEHKRLEFDLKDKAAHAHNVSLR